MNDVAISNIFFSTELRTKMYKKMPAGQNAACNLFDQIYLIKDNNFSIFAANCVQKKKKTSYKSAGSLMHF